MSLSESEFRRACGCWATGVAVLTMMTKEEVPHGITINSFVSLSLDPPLIMAAIAHTSAQLPAFDDAKYFAVNILMDDQRDLSTRFARPGEHRFRDLYWGPGPFGSPIFMGVQASIECKTTTKYDAGDHRIIVGEAVHAHVRDGKPLLYFRGQYRNFD